MDNIANGMATDAKEADKSKVLSSKPNTDVLDDEDDDIPQLSAHALAALHDFYDEQAAIEKALEEAKKAGDDNSILFKTDLGTYFPEDWVIYGSIMICIMWIKN